MLPFYSTTKRTKGFTLIELIVVMAIMTLLSVIVITSFNAARRKARDARRFADLLQIQSALELYANEHGGRYPVNTTSAGAYHGQWTSNTTGCVPAQPAGAVMAKDLAPTYMGAIPKDPFPDLSGSAAQKKCYLYYATEDGFSYKFLVKETFETLNPQTTNHPLKDPQGRVNSAAIYSESGASF